MSDTLRVLLIGADPRQTSQICSRLAGANHSVFAACGLDEASEALEIQRFDAVLLGAPLESDAIGKFTAKLREIEARQRVPNRAPILSCNPPTAPDNFQADGCVPPGFEPALLVETVANLSRAVSQQVKSECDFPAFDIEKLKSQAGQDRELITEIVGLFLADHQNQIAQMRQSLEMGDYTQLSYLAHTMKGSFGTLGGMLCWYRAQQLEFAAKRCDEESCRNWLRLLEDGLSDLLPHLQALCTSSDPV